MGYDLAAVDVDGEARGGWVVGDTDDAVTVLEEVFEDGEVGLDRVRFAWNRDTSWLVYLVVDLTPCLIFKVVVLESLKAINADVEIRCI